MPRKTYIDPKNLPPVDRVTLRRIFSYLAPYRRHAWMVALTVVGMAILALVPPLLVKRVVDYSIPERHVADLLICCAGMVAAPLAAALLGVGKKYLTALVGERVMFDMRVQLFRHLHRQPLGYFTNARPGEAISRVLNDVAGVGSVMSSTLVSVFDNAIVLLTTSVLVFWLDWRLALIAVVLLPLFVIPTRRVARKRKLLRRTSQAKMAELTGMLTETLSVSGALHLKVYGTEKHEARRLKGKSREIMTLSIEQTLLGRWFQMLLGLFETAGPALVFAVGGYLAMRGNVALGTIVAFVTLLRRLYSPASSLAGVHIDVVTSYAYFERIFAVLDLPPAIANAPAAHKLRKVKGRLTFRHVSFSYGPDDHTLIDVDLDIAPGQFVALVGPSGSGKSTMAAMVPRLYDPTEGAILIDDKDLRALRLRSLRAHIGVVTQETFLFHASVMDNLRYARPEATDAEVEAAARTAQIHDFLAGLPEGYQTLVGDRGYRLSGGERQRLAIARVILRNPRVLILDEATSALDSANEAAIQTELQKLAVGRTSLVIAHRLSTIRDADLIVVLERGRIVERGKHEELLAAGGLYARLYHEQMGSLMALPAPAPPEAAPAPDEAAPDEAAPEPPDEPVEADVA